MRSVRISVCAASQPLAGIVPSAGAHHQRAVSQPPARQVDHHPPHLLDRVQCADVVPPRKLVHITPQMLDAQLVIGAPTGALEQAPEQFQTIGMHQTIDVLAGTVPHRLVDVPRQLPIGSEIIGMQPRAGLDMGGDEPMQTRPVAHLDHLNLHLLTAPRLGSNHRRLAASSSGNRSCSSSKSIPSRSCRPGAFRAVFFIPSHPPSCEMNCSSIRHIL